MAQHYSDPNREPIPTALPDVETFQVRRDNVREFRNAREDGEPLRCGWYWQPCFPGCLPDGDPVGPFRSEAAAVRDAQEGAE